MMGHPRGLVTAFRPDDYPGHPHPLLDDFGPSRTSRGVPVEESTEPLLLPGESLSATSTGDAPGRGPCELTVSLESTSLTTDWTAAEFSVHS